MNSDRARIKNLATYYEFQATSYKNKSDVMLFSEILKPASKSEAIRESNSESISKSISKSISEDIVYKFNGGELDAKSGSGDFLYIMRDCNNTNFILKVFNKKNKDALSEITKHIDFSHLFVNEYNSSKQVYVPCPLIYMHGILSGMKPFSSKGHKIKESNFIIMEKLEGLTLHEYFNNCLSDISDEEMYDIIIQLFFLISRMKVNEQGIYMSHCDLHTGNIYICDKPGNDIDLDFNHIDIDNKYRITHKVVKILDLGESFEYKKTPNGKKYKTCRLNRSMSKKVAQTFSKCYDKKYKIEEGNSYKRQFMKKTKKGFKKGAKYFTALSQQARRWNKTYGDEDIKFFVSILRLFLFKFKGIEKDIDHIEKIAAFISLADNFYNKDKTKKDFQKIIDNKYVINYELTIDESPRENCKNILGGIYHILSTNIRKQIQK